VFNHAVTDGAIAKGIGTDLLDQRRIAKLIGKTGERFSARILTPQELLLWSDKGHSVNFLAKRFAAKEAISKALGTGMAKGVGFQQMNIYSDSLGKPVVELSGAALIRAKALEGKQVLLSLSDEGEMILAFAVLT
jgi:holo-[acyl-carrier protein] synthase